MGSLGADGRGLTVCAVLILDMHIRPLTQIYDGNQSRTAEYRRQTIGKLRHDSRHLHTSECAIAEKKKKHKRMCFTVIIAPVVIQKEQCAAEYHWQL